MKWVLDEMGLDKLGPTRFNILLSLMDWQAAFWTTVYMRQQKLSLGSWYIQIWLTGCSRHMPPANLFCVWVHRFELKQLSQSSGNYLSMQCRNISTCTQTRLSMTGQAVYSNTEEVSRRHVCRTTSQPYLHISAAQTRFLLPHVNSCPRVLKLAGEFLLPLPPHCTLWAAWLVFTPSTLQ